MQYLELVTLALIPGFLLLDFVVRRRAFHRPRFWRLRAFAFTVGIFGLTTSAALFWGNTLGDLHLIDGSGLGIAGGALVGILVYELLHYAYHRLVHRYDLLWRFVGHQVHHSAESLDAWGANFMHPIDALGFTAISSLVFFPLLGLVPEAGAIGAAFLLFNAMFQHANIRTPRWLGYVIQRPESHQLHHARGRHRSNYSDLPLWDMVFGTFENPAADDPRLGGECGFYDGASTRVLAMLAGVDVSQQPKAEKPTRKLQTAGDSRRIAA